MRRRDFIKGITVSTTWPVAVRAQQSAKTHRIALIESPIQGEEYRRALAAMAQEHVDAVIIGDQTEHGSYRQLIVNLVRAAKLPAIFPFREYFEIGALMAYGPLSSDIYRRLALYIDQILKGAHPGDLPIYLAAKFELLINLATAKAIGLTIPPSLLVSADEVIE